MLCCVVSARTNVIDQPTSSNNRAKRGQPERTNAAAAADNTNAVKRARQSGRLRKQIVVGWAVISLPSGFYIYLILFVFISVYCV